MEVILKQDLNNLGYTDDIIKVKAGYARNYLIPRGLAELATESSKLVLAEKLKQRAHKEKKLKGDAQAVAKQLEEMTLKIGAKVGENGRIYGSITPLQISEALYRHGVEVDRKKIQVDDEHIKSLGTYTATVLVHKDIKAKVKFEVVPE